MSERETFITRWSRRKRAAPASRSEAELREGGDPGALPLPADREPPELADGSSAQIRPKAEPAVDLGKLPPIDSITAKSDVSAFLAPGVPVELTRAALRRAWTVDPAIRDFIGLSENSWDFNAPDAIAGFGPLEMTDDLRRQVARFVGRNIAGTADDTASSPQETKETPPPIERAVLSDTTDCTARLTQDASKPGEPDRAALESAERLEPATQGKQRPDPAPPPRRSHGGA